MALIHTASQMQHKEANMKTATIPSLRVDPELRNAAEGVLKEGETLSSFVEQSLRLNIEHRRAQHAFIERGLASRDEAQRTGEYFPAPDVLRELDELLARSTRSR
jgi:predicted transcriptional regulator